MRGHTARSALALGAAALLAAAVQPASAVAPASSSAAPVVKQVTRTVLVDCLWHPKVRPTEFILACGDGNSRLSSLHWSQWKGDAAVATGVNAVNDCKPYCAAGAFHDYPVVVSLDRPETWKKHPRLRHYTRMILTYPEARPEGFPPVVTYPLWN
ncbi:hypothetical protein ACIO93_03475 [Streptomyces sp. NPDC087903]|uniref:hypothetical protein n=1 Tax=unclassified Streptomyces TaxID=2593676 RepID=UPI00324597A0